MDWRAKTGRVIAGVELRVVDEEGEVLPNDGKSVGEFEVRGPWVTAAYYGDPSPERFHDGWLRTGDVGSLDGRGFMQISDRTKDVIKSGGEWISSVELENEVMAHPGVYEAAVIGVPDERWDERPLVVIVPAEGARPEPAEILAFLSARVARWWLPERWAFADEIPKTSVGKFDKKVLRAKAADGHPRDPRGRPPRARPLSGIGSSVGSRPDGEGGEWTSRTSPTGSKPSPRSSAIWPSTGCARRRSMAGRGATPDPAVVAEEKRLTRARRSVQKAVVVLRRSPGPAVEADAVTPPRRHGLARGVSRRARSGRR